jgi:2-methylcitrate dehydratase PrpD
MAASAPIKARFEALLSAHYAAAAILHDGALSLAQFAPARYDDPALRSFAKEKVEIRADAALSGSQAKVHVILNDGARLSAYCEHPLGAFENPLSRVQVEQKFRLYATSVLPDARIEEVIEEVIDAVNRLETFDSVRELMALLRAAPRTRAMAAAE